MALSAPRPHARPGKIFRYGWPFHGEQYRSPNKVDKPACCLAGQPPLHSDLVCHQRTSAALLLEAHQHQQLQEEAANMPDCPAGCVQLTCKQLTSDAMHLVLHAKLETADKWAAVRLQEGQSYGTCDMRLGTFAAHGSSLSVLLTHISLSCEAPVIGFLTSGPMHT